MERVCFVQGLMLRVQPATELVEVRVQPATELVEMRVQMFKCSLVQMFCCLNVQGSTASRSTGY